MNIRIIACKYKPLVFPLKRGTLAHFMRSFCINILILNAKI